MVTIRSISKNMLVQCGHNRVIKMLMGKLIIHTTDPVQPPHSTDFAGLVLSFFLSFSINVRGIPTTGNISFSLISNFSL